MNVQRLRLRLARASMGTLYRAVPRPWRRDILLVCSNSLNADYLADLWSLVRDDRRLRFHLHEASGPDRSDAHDHIRRKLPLPQVSKSWARVRPWDLIVTADHDHGDLVHPGLGPTLRIQHGIAAGGRVNGKEYTFGERAFDPRGRPRYRRMFVSSDANRQRAVEVNPRWDDVIAVVGDLQDDRLLGLVPRRAAIRRSLGLRDADRAVFVLSTWGPHSLFNTMGGAILDEARNLYGEFRFILNVHPHEYRPRPDGRQDWGGYLRSQREHGFLVRDPSDDWMPYLVACDVVLTDRTSLALHAAVLRRPTVYVPMADELLDPQGLAWRLRGLSPQVKPSAANLRDCLREALHAFPRERLAEIGNVVNSYPGEAAGRMRVELYNLLKLEPDAAWATPGAGNRPERPRPSGSF